MQEKNPPVLPAFTKTTRVKTDIMTLPPLKAIRPHSLLFCSMMCMAIGCGSKPKPSSLPSSRTNELEALQKQQRAEEEKIKNRKARETKALKEACQRKTERFYQPLPDLTPSFATGLGLHIKKRSESLNLPGLPYTRDRFQKSDLALHLSSKGKIRVFRNTIEDDETRLYEKNSRTLLKKLSRKSGSPQHVLLFVEKSTSYKHLYNLRRKLHARISLSIIGELSSKGQLALHQTQFPFTPRSLSIALAQALEVTRFNRLAASNIVIDRQNYKSCEEAAQMLKTVTLESLDDTSFQSLGDTLRQCNCGHNPESTYSSALFRLGETFQALTSHALPEKDERTIWRKTRKKLSVQGFLHGIVAPEKNDPPATVISQRYLRGIHGCYNKQLQKNALLRGRVTIGITLDKTGSVKESKIKGFNDEIDSCIEVQARDWKFSPETNEEGKPIEKTYQIPIELKQSR